MLFANKGCDRIRVTSTIGGVGGQRRGTADTGWYSIIDIPSVIV